MQFCCASNSAFKNVKVARKKINFLTFASFSKNYRLLENSKKTFRHIVLNYFLGKVPNAQ